jgi:hypothetical protein
MKRETRRRAVDHGLGTEEGRGQEPQILQMDADENDFGVNSALESAVLPGNAPLERSQLARLSPTTTGRGDGGSSRAWHRRPGDAPPMEPAACPRSCRADLSRRSDSPGSGKCPVPTERNPVVAGEVKEARWSGTGAGPVPHRRSESASHILCCRHRSFRRGPAEAEGFAKVEAQRPAVVATSGPREHGAAPAARKTQIRRRTRRLQQGLYGGGRASSGLQLQVQYLSPIHRIVTMITTTMVWGG